MHSLWNADQISEFSFFFCLATGGRYVIKGMTSSKYLGRMKFKSRLSCREDIAYISVTGCVRPGMVKREHHQNIW